MPGDITLLDERGATPAEAAEIPWTVMCYNVQSMSAPGRLDLLLSDLRREHVHIAVLVGTMRRSDLATETLHTEHFWIYYFSAGRGRFTNRSTGIFIVLARRRFPRRCVQKIWSFPQSLGGRLAAVRLKSRLFDLTVVGGYAPPNIEGQSKAAHAYYAHLYKFFGELPARTLPLLLTDANGHLGYDELGLVSPSIGKYNLSQENSNGSLLRRFLEHHQMLAANTYYENPPTFYGNNSATRVDYICVPRAAADHIKHCRVWTRFGDRNQLARCSRRLDHRPVVLCFRYRGFLQTAACSRCSVG